MKKLGSTFPTTNGPRARHPITRTVCNYSYLDARQQLDGLAYVSRARDVCASAAVGPRTFVVQKTEAKKNVPSFVAAEMIPREKRSRRTTRNSALFFTAVSVASRRLHNARKYSSEGARAVLRIYI